MDAAPACSRPERIGRYVLEGQLGEGGMGTVYRAYDPLLDRHVALKVLRPDPSQDPATRADWAARMLREAQTAASFLHPNAVAVYDVGTDAGAPFIAMELVRGETLRERIGDATVPMERRVRWLVDIARALAAAHRAGIVHRDVKPENVLVTPEGAIKILDFGIARRTALTLAAGGGATGNAPTLTAEGMILGTPQYMAPEQIRSECLDGRADQFAWGAVAFELLTGRSLWARSTEPLRLIASILTSIPPPPGSVSPAISDAVSAIVVRTLAKRPDERFEDMDQVAFALEAAAGLSPLAAGTAGLRPTGPVVRGSLEALAPSAPPTRRADAPLRYMAAVALGALAIGALVGLLVFARRGAHPPAFAATGVDRPPSSAPETAAAVAPSSATRHRIAVMPFENLTRRPEDDWLQLGLADALQSKLGSLSGFDVVSQTATGTLDAAAARKRGAEWLALGSFQKVGDQIRVAARFEAADDSRRVLATTEQRGPMARLFDLQDALAVALARKVDETPTAAPDKNVPHTGTRNLEAFAAFNSGRSLLASGRVAEAMRAFDAAVRADPEYRDARATLNRVRAESHHFLVKSDGAVVETIAETISGDPTSPWELTTDSGVLTRAWDFDGNPLAVERVAANGDQASFRVAIGPREREGPRGIVYELESASKDRRRGGLGVLFHAVSKNASGDETFIVQLPPAAKALAVIPTAAETREDDAGTFLVIRESRSAFTPYAWSIVHSSDGDVVARFRDESLDERTAWIASADPRMARHGWASDLARAADVGRTCALAAAGDVDKAVELLGRMAAAPDAYGPFFVARGQFCIARAQRDDRAAVAALEAALIAPGRPAQLVPEAFLDAIEWCLERKRIDDMARLVALERREAPWWNDGVFHARLPRESDDRERVLRELLAAQPANVAAGYDLALTLYRAKRYEQAAQALQGVDEFLAGAYLSDLGARIAIARGEGEEAAVALRHLVREYPMTWAWTAHAVLLASADRAEEALAVVARQTAKAGAEPPAFWALRYVVGVLPHASRYAGRILEVVKQAKETAYGEPYRLDRLVDLIEVASLSVDPDAPRLVASLFGALKAMLRETRPEVCGEACLTMMGSHLCRVRTAPPADLAWVTGTTGQRCD